MDTLPGAIMGLEVGVTVSNRAKLSRSEHPRWALQRRWDDALLGEGGSFQRGKGSTTCVTDQGTRWAVKRRVSAAMIVAVLGGAQIYSLFTIVDRKIRLFDL